MLRKQCMQRSWAQQSLGVTAVNPRMGWGGWGICVLTSVKRCCARPARPDACGPFHTRIGSN